MRLGILQLDPMIGDPQHNADVIEQWMRRHAAEFDLFVTPEQTLIGYPARDALSFPNVLDAEANALGRLAALTKELGVGLLIGHCERRKGPGRPLYNAASLYDGGELKGRVRKMRLPVYDVFDDERFFEAAPTDDAPAPLEFRGTRLAVMICEDLWQAAAGFGPRDVRTYPKSKTLEQRSLAADLTIVVSASPFTLAKRALREDLAAAWAHRTGKPLLYVNASGGQDDIIFDGNSFVVRADTGVTARGPAFAVGPWALQLQNGTLAGADHAVTGEWETVERALVTGFGAFVRKCGNPKLVLGLSGGIDSALCATLAARAVGADRVLGVSLPSSLTSDLSKDEARETARRLGIKFREIPVAPLVDAAANAIGARTGLAFENIQSRARGMILNGLANAEGRLVVATGNKSELAMGYATLYGDLAGAMLPIGDLYKTEVYALSHDINARAGTGAPIPAETLRRPPTAELAPGQKDSDSLPEYAILDGLLKELIENQGETHFDEATWNRLLGDGHSVASIRARLHAQEFKRRQAPPILKIHERSFGVGWRMPVAKGRLP